MPSKPSNSDMTFFKEYMDEVLFKLEVKHVESQPCTPETKPKQQPKPEEQPPEMRL